MLAPKKTKFRKAFRGAYHRVATKGDLPSYGRFGLRSLSPYMITANQIEAVRVVLSRETRKVGRYWIRIFPHLPYSKKAPETGMGGGKGDVAYYVSKISAGTIMFEIDGVTAPEAENIFRKAASKLPVLTKIIDRDDG
ncbi:MAG: 50S ribosomal protein L16 [Patescibacteria group bacterium]